MNSDHWNHIPALPDPDAASALHAAMHDAA